MMPIRPLLLRNPSAGPYGSHRYWRVYSTANDGHATQTGIAEVEFRGSVGGADLTGSGTPLSGGSGADVAGSEAAKAYDNTTQPWVRSATSGVWIGYDFGSAVAVAEVQLTALTTQPERNITAGSVDWSDDGSTWTQAFSFSIFAWTPSQNRTLPETTPAAGTYRSLRISIATNNGDARVGIAEIEFRASIGGADQATGGVAKASSEFSGSFPAGAAFADNATGSQWLSNTLSSEWIRYDFPNPVSLVQTMIQGYSSTVARSPKDFTIQGSNDGTWTTLFSPASQTGWTAGEIRTFS